MDIKERIDGQDFWEWLEPYVRVQMSRGWYPLLFVTSSSMRPRQLLVYESDGLRGGLLQPPGVGMPSEEEILRALQSSLARRTCAGETLVAVVCYPHQAEHEEKVISNAEMLDGMGLTASQVSRVVCDAYVRKSLLASCPSGDLARVEATLDAEAHRDATQRGVAGVLLIWEDDVERVPMERREAEVEWWPEHLAPIASQFEGAMARGYTPCALLVQLPKSPHMIAHLVYADAVSVTSGSTGSLEQKIRRWDTLIGQAEEQGLTVVALVCAGDGGDVLTVLALDYPVLSERGIGPDDIEKATMSAIQELRVMSGKMWWPLGPVTWV